LALVTDISVPYIEGCLFGGGFPEEVHWVFGGKYRITVNFVTFRAGVVRILDNPRCDPLIELELFVAAAQI